MLEQTRTRKKLQEAYGKGKECYGSDKERKACRNVGLRSRSPCEFSSNGGGNCMTDGGDRAGAKCVFPFTLEGITYQGCTRTNDPDDRLWCSTKTDSKGVHVSGQGEWGHCNSDCPTDQGICGEECARQLRILTGCDNDQCVADRTTEKNINNHNPADYNNTLLHVAAEKDFLEAAKFLIIEGADVEAKDKFHHTPLHLSAWKKALKVSTLLVENGANKEAKDRGGLTPLHYPASTNALGVATLLVENGANKEAKSNSGYTPLHEAAQYNALKVAKMLMDNGANKDAVNDYGKKPIDYAKSDEMKELLR